MGEIKMASRSHKHSRSSKPAKSKSKLPDVTSIFLDPFCYLYRPVVDVSWKTVLSGEPGTSEFQLSVQNSQGEIFSPWHSVQLYSESGHLNCVCTSPRGSCVPLEVATTKSEAPLRVSRRSGELYRLSNNKFNLGFLPQTYSDPYQYSEDTGKALKGDGRPIDVIDIGRVRVKPGDVYAVNPIAAIGIVNPAGAELSWKLIVIAVDDPLAGSLTAGKTSVVDLPLILKELNEFVLIYLSPGNRTEYIGFKGRALGAEQAACIVADAHSQWQLNYAENEKVCIQCKTIEPPNNESELLKSDIFTDDVKGGNENYDEDGSDDDTRSQVIEGIAEDAEYNSSDQSNDGSFEFISKRNLESRVDKDEFTLDKTPLDNENSDDSKHRNRENTWVASEIKFTSPKSNVRFRIGERINILSPTALKPENAKDSIELQCLSSSNKAEFEKISKLEYVEEASLNETKTLENLQVLKSKIVPENHLDFSEEISPPTAKAISWSEHDLEDLYPFGCVLPPFTPRKASPKCHDACTLFPADLRKRVTFSDVVEVIIYEADDCASEEIYVDSVDSECEPQVEVTKCEFINVVSKHELTPASPPSRTTKVKCLTRNGKPWQHKGIVYQGNPLTVPDNLGANMSFNSTIPKGDIRDSRGNVFKLNRPWVSISSEKTCRNQIRRGQGGAKESIVRGLAQSSVVASKNVVGRKLVTPPSLKTGLVWVPSK